MYFIKKGLFTVELINLLILPVVVSEAVSRCMGQDLKTTWDHLFYYGWNILLCLWSGHLLTGVIRSLLMRDITADSLAYSFLMAVFYSLLCFLANLILKNLSLKAEFDHAEKE